MMLSSENAGSFHVFCVVHESTNNAKVAETGLLLF